MEQLAQEQRMSREEILEQGNILQRGKKSQTMSAYFLKLCYCFWVLHVFLKVFLCNRHFRTFISVFTLFACIVVQFFFKLKVLSVIFLFILPL